MLIEINLLPKKPPKNMANYLTILIVVFLLGVGLLYFYYQSLLMRADIIHLSAQQQGVEATRIEVEKELERINRENTEIEAQQKLIDVISQTIYTTEIIAEVKRHLPANASIRSYTYVGGETMTFRLLAKKSSDVGMFVENLNTISWVQQASLVSSTLESSGEHLGSITVTLNRDALLS